MVVFAILTSCGSQPSEEFDEASLENTQSDLKFLNFLWETFERSSIGASLPSDYIWVKNGSSRNAVTDQAPAKGKHSLVVEIPDDSSERDYIGIKFCLNTTAPDILAASFDLKLNNLVNWTGLGVLGDEDNMQYWWWVRADGTVFNGHTFDSFMEDVWQKVEIIIDRSTNRAMFAVDGNETYFDLNLEWTMTDPNDPMQCIFAFMGVFDTPQSIQIDNVTMLGY